VWLLTYDSRDPAPRGVLFSYSRTPWGPWSEPQIIFNAMRDGAVGEFIHNPQAIPDDGLAGPVIGKGQANPQAVHGGAYAPYVVERWMKVQGSDLSIYYVLSTWNPYVVGLEAFDRLSRSPQRHRRNAARVFRHQLGRCSWTDYDVTRKTLQGRRV
jgi:hypothetical protein